MRIVNIDKVSPGDILGKSLYNKVYELVVSAGFKLTEEMIDTLRRRKYYYIYLMDELTKDIYPEEVVSETVRVMTNRLIADALESVSINLAFEAFAPEEIKKRLEEGSEGPSFRMSQVRKAVTSLVDEIIQSGKKVFAALPIGEGSASDLQHSLDVTVLSVLIGQKFGFNEEEMKQLGTAAMLHDVGKLAFPAIKSKTFAERSREERMIIREHPVYSMLILRGSDPDAFIEHVVVLQHHELFDGSGYPNRVKGEMFPPTRAFKRKKNTMHRFSEIVATANYYDNLVRGEHDGTSRSPQEAITEMATVMKGKFNPHILNILPQLIQCYPTGAIVRVGKTSSGNYDGWYGIIARSNPEVQSKPMVLLTHDTYHNEVKPMQVDFITEKEVSLQLIL
ncbi:MAG: HD domain-containing phosphohydrolase [bacterium]